jgi:hypothetical protein
LPEPVVTAPPIVNPRVRFTATVRAISLNGKRGRSRTVRLKPKSGVRR